MRKIIPLLFLPLVCIVLWGCPYDSPYGIDAAAQENIDESLLGSWATFVSKPAYDQQHAEDPVKIIFSKNTDQEYYIAITGYIDELKPYHVITNDTIKGTAFISTVSSRQFLNCFIKGRMYLAEINRRDDNLSILCLAEKFTVRYIKNSKDLRREIEFHSRFDAVPTYDDFFVARNLKKVN
jgi:hypothetical protein